VEPPEISVVVAARDAEDTLDACLEAIARQTLARARYEIVVVDNGSSDATAEIAARHAGVVLVAERRKGAYVARNAGLYAARGATIAFTDADCVAAPDWLERLTGTLSADGARVVVGAARPVGTGRALRLLSAYEDAKESYVFAHSDPGVYFGRTNNLVTRRRELERTGGFDPLPRGADSIFVQKIIERHGAGTVRYEGRALVHHTEIESARDYFRKVFVYGSSLRGYGRAVPARALTQRERLLLFRRVVATLRLSRLEAAVFFALLFVGGVAYGAGWLSGPPAELPSPSPRLSPLATDGDGT